MKFNIISLLAYVRKAVASMVMKSYMEPTDATKAAEIAKKAQKLIASGKPQDAEKARDLYERAAIMGLRSAQRWMADYHWSQMPPNVNHWSQTPPNVKAAMVWEDALAQQGDTHSQYLLGCIYLGYDKRNFGIAPDEAKGYAYMKMAADWGIRDAQYIIGDCLLKGIGVEQNYDQAFIWMKRAADQNNMHAQFCVGSYYFFGDGQCDVDYKKALEYYSLSALQGLAEAQYNLGHMYQYAEGVEKNLDDAIYWYTKAAEQGHRFAKNNLALAIEEKNGSNENSLYLISKSADEGDGLAQYNLGLRYSGGNGVTQDAEMAVYWYTKSANNGCAKGQLQLGLAYIEGIGVAKDESKGFEWISKSAEQKDTAAINILGGCYENGLGVTADPQKAFQCYKEAADLDFADALYQVARCYYYGIGVTHSYSDAFAWAKKACSKNVRDAYLFLADEYHTGECIQKDLTTAIVYYMKAAELAEDKNEEVYFRIALCYGEMLNQYKKIAYFKKAADLGSVKALYNLAVCYGYGDGVKLDIDKCESLLRKCANQDKNKEIKRLAKEGLSAMQVTELD